MNLSGAGSAPSLEFGAVRLSTSGFIHELPRSRVLGNSHAACRDPMPRLIGAPDPDKIQERVRVALEFVREGLGG